LLLSQVVLSLGWSRKYQTLFTILWAGNLLVLLAYRGYQSPPRAAGL
jgi:hypothetical protein